MKSETDIYHHEWLLAEHLIVVNMSVRYTWSPVIACFLQAGACRRTLCEPRRHRLRLQCELAGEEAMVLTHRRLAARHDVMGEGRGVGQGRCRAIDASRSFLVDEE